MVNYEDRILFNEFIDDEEELDTISSEYESKGELVAACSVIFSENIPPMDITVAYLANEGQITCGIEMTTSSSVEISSDYNEIYKLSGIAADKFKKLDDETLADITIKISARFCGDIINNKYNREIQIADYSKNRQQEQETR